jgi:hypothetical protein
LRDTRQPQNARTSTRTPGCCWTSSTGDEALSVRVDETEEAWPVMEPTLQAWAADRVSLQEYPAGSEGPE